MDFFRWKRTFLRALIPAMLCATLAGWGVYVLTADERPTYRSQALLNTGIMTGRDGSGSYVRDLVLNELENIMNLARSFETREELSAVLLAKLLSLDQADGHVISARAYDDFYAELEPSLLERFKPFKSEELIYKQIIADRDSLKRFGESTADHPLIELLYGADPLVGAESLANLRVNRKGMSDLLEISYSTVDAVWCKLTLDEHIRVFLDQHSFIEDQRSGGALAYFNESTNESRKKLNDAENRLRDFSTNNKIINYYEQTRFIASVKNQVDSRYVEEEMKQAASDSTLQVLERKLAKRMNLVRLNNIVDDRRRELGKLSREKVRIEIMAADSSETAESDLKVIDSEMERIRKELSTDITSLQGVYNGPEGLELGKLITEWLAVSIQVEEAKGKLEILARRKNDFGTLYTDMASLGSRMKKLEREVHIAEEEYLENLSNLNEARQKEHSQRSITDLRLVDAPVIPTKPEKSKRLIMVFAAFFVGGIFPIILAIALELLSGAILSFAEGERRTELLVVGGVARWSTVRKLLRRKFEPALRSTTADLLWQGLNSRGNKVDRTKKPHIIVLTSFQPGAGKTYIAKLLANRLAKRGMQVCVASDRPSDADMHPGIRVSRIDSIQAMTPGVDPRALTGIAVEQWQLFDVVIWELPAMATGRFPVGIARSAHDALLIHPASSGWTGAHAGSLAQLKDALGQAPQLVLNGISADVLLNEWGSTWKQIRSWSEVEELDANRELELQQAAKSKLLDTTPAFSEHLLKEELESPLKKEVFEPLPRDVEHLPPDVYQSPEAKLEQDEFLNPLSEDPVLQVTEVRQVDTDHFQLPDQPTTPAPFPSIRQEISEGKSQISPEAEGEVPISNSDDWEQMLLDPAEKDSEISETIEEKQPAKNTDWEHNLLF